MPLIRRLPKRGFNNAAFHKHYAIVNLDDLNEFKAETTVNEQLLRESNLVRGHFVGIKILGDGELKHGLKVEADKVSVSAREKIEKAGGTIILRLRDETRAPKEMASQEDVDLATGAASAKSTSRVTGQKKSKRNAPLKRQSQAKNKTSRES
jgi:ribosomal protein L18E